jgi:organic hydroperoxide reductase OsmC/OhrA
MSQAYVPSSPADQAAGAPHRAAVTIRRRNGGHGRSSSARSDDGGLDVVVHPLRGQSGIGATTPEHLVAAGHAASFHEVLSSLAVAEHVDPSKLSVEAELSMQGDDALGHRSLSAALTVRWPGVGRRVAQDLIARASERDPCSRMARDGMPSTAHLVEGEW